MCSEIEELIISEKNTISEVIEYIKILINKSEKLKLIANRKSSVIIAKASESLIDLGYVKYDNIQTKTDNENGRNNVKLIITLQKNQFIDLFEENIKNENYIKGEIEINDSLTKRIINSYSKDEKMNEYCDIYINNIKIKFNKYYSFPKEGTYSIIYKFNKLLSSAKGMFYECDALKSLDLSNFNTEKITDMSFMFSSCRSLTNINLSNFNTQNVKEMYHMFCDCSSLINLDLSNFNTQNVTSMGFMFYGCYSLTNLDLSNFNTENVGDMMWMFSEAKSLINLDLSNFNTQNVIGMDDMFHGCKSLINLDLSNFNTQKVLYMNNMFSGCNSLTNVNLSNFNTKKVLFKNNMFLGCNSLIKKIITFIE